MRYVFNVVVNNGVAEVMSNGEPLPEGSWQIGGNEDEHGAGINVTHRHPNGQFAAEAQHYRSHYNYDPANFALIQPGMKDIKAALIAAGMPEDRADAIARESNPPATSWTEDGGQEVQVAPAYPNDGIPRKNLSKPVLPRRHPQGNINHQVDPDC